MIFNNLYFFRTFGYHKQWRKSVSKMNHPQQKIIFVNNINERKQKIVCINNLFIGSENEF